LTKAPDVTKVGGSYYLLYSVSTWGSQDSEIGYATSQDLENWTDHGTTGIHSNANKQPFNAIHGSLVHTSDGSKHYMAFGSFWQDIYLADMQSIPTTQFGSEKQIAYQPSGEHGIEAPFIYEHQGTWYMFFSAGKCCYFDVNRPPKGQEYKMMACRSRSAIGPYEDLNGKDCNKGGGTIILASHDWVYGPGSQGVYNDPREGPVIYYSYSK
jgi:arabinan endo-1,5-alpha-L-arabinosidase